MCTALYTGRLLQLLMFVVQLLPAIVFLLDHSTTYGSQKFSHMAMLVAVPGQQQTTGNISRFCSLVKPWYSCRWLGPRLDTATRQLIAR